MIKGVIFDLDGTLLDTLGDLANSVNEVLSTMGFPTHSTDAYRYFVGDGIKVALGRALGEHNSEENVAEALRLMKLMYQKHFDRNSMPFEGILEMLDYCKHANLQCAVCSNKIDEYTQKLVLLRFPHFIFDAITGERTDEKRKPDPALALRVLQQMNLEAHECLFVGDTKTDMLTAKAVGCYAVGVTWGFRDELELRENQADFIINHPSELKKIIQSLSQ